jgi:two-component system, sensor histidine kinase
MQDPAPRTLDASPAGDILVVDDHAANLATIEAVLGDLGERLIMARSGPEALRKLLRHDFALILLDVQMPTMDGFETAMLIRSRERSRLVPIVFVTAFDTDEAEVLAAYELGAVDFLFKPIRPEILRAKASVFVALQQRTLEVKRQAALLFEHERRAHERRLAAEKERWEQEELRRRMEQARQSEQELARRADELARAVAERELAERELRQSNQRLAEADRRKDEFLATLAHELRNPLTPLVAGTELLRRRLRGDETSFRCCATMLRQLEHLRRLVDDLLDVARITAGKIALQRGPTDLRDIIRQAVATCQPRLDEQGQTLTLRLPDEPIEIEADDVRLVQVVYNLLHNASRYSEPGGAIDLTGSIEGDEAVVRVADRGHGIPTELIDSVFDAFVQRRTGDGLGLGLALVRHLVGLHHGRVEASSLGEGQGSVFTVRLPRLRPAVAGASPAGLESPCDAPSTGLPEGAKEAEAPLKIVLVEDNDDIREVLEGLLASLGHRVHMAADGAQGLELLHSIRADVALVDIGLPKLSGYDVAERARASLDGELPRLVAMTGYGREVDRRRAMAAGFHDYLIKPPTVDALMRVLRRTS